ncbi:MAG: phosphate ABC transporter ATP-binding protein, partial [Deltaproteobacteria bacterium]|nr:phosphate ABC transporter ATP-binding protein [Deltaproteobacteria bacterium]
MTGNNRPDGTSSAAVSTSCAAHSIGDTILETRNLSRVVMGKVLVNNISVQAQQGEILAVVGPSGAGKSSFLRLINRLDEPTGGTVHLAGRDYKELAPRELRRRVGMVMQSAYLFPGTVAENLCYGPRQHGEALPRSEIDNLLEQVGLEGFASRDVSHLSGGEAQRVSLARTLANKPEVLLLDEPSSALDERAEREIEVLLLRVLRDQHLTALIVTHDTAQTERIASRAILIEAGRLILNGTV